MSGYGATFTRGSAGGPGLTPDRRRQLGSQGDNYAAFANPFFDQAGTYTPTTVKELYAYCRHFHLTHGLINAINTKAAEYPVTDLIFEANEPSLVARYEELFFEGLDYSTQQIAINVSKNVYGIAFVSVNFPFEKFLRCGACKEEISAMRSRPFWRYTVGRFRLTCPKCGATGPADSADRPQRKASEISLMNWNPEQISIFENEVTGRKDYVYEPSPRFRQAIKLGRKDLVCTTPELFLEAVRLDRPVVLDPSRVFVMKRPGLPQQGGGSGIPLMFPVLKDAYYLQVMKRANETICLQHLVPQIFIFPQPSTSGADPYVTASLSDWRDTIRAELAIQRRDPAYYGVVPFPLGHQVIGENGRSLMLLPEIQEQARQICIGMGFPPDLIFGNGSYAGNSVNMRMLENVFLGDVRQHKRLLRFVLTQISTFMNWPPVTGRFKPFRMADDLQRQGFFFTLNQAKKISDTTLLSLVDLRVDTETKLQSEEVAARGAAMREMQSMEASIQSDAQVIMAKGQSKAQEVMAEAQAKAMAPKPDPFIEAVSSPVNQAAGLNDNASLRALADAVRSMPEGRKQLFMKQLQDQSPDISQLLLQQQQQQMAEQGGAPAEDPAAQGAQPGDGTHIDMRPLPQQLPPRRASMAG